MTRKTVVTIAMLVVASITTGHTQTRRPRLSYAHETADRHSRTRLSGEQFDPQEDDPHLRKLFDAADVAVDQQLTMPQQMGFIRYFWEVKKKFLNETYGIDWKSPAELNPRVAYD